MEPIEGKEECLNIPLKKDHELSIIILYAASRYSGKSTPDALDPMHLLLIQAGCTDSVMVVYLNPLFRSIQTTSGRQ